MDEQTPPNKPQTPTLATQTSPTKNKSMTIGIVIVLVLLIAGGAIGYWQYQKNRSDNGSIAAPTNNQPTPTNEPVPTATSTSENPGVQPQCKNPGPILASKSGAVRWQEAQDAEHLAIFGSTSTSTDSEFGGDSSAVVGHFTSGPYQGGDLLITSITWNAPGGPSLLFIVKQEDKYTVLDKYSDALPDASVAKPVVNLTEDKSFDLADLDFPQTIHSASPAASYTYVANLGFLKNGTQPFCADNLRKVFIDPSVGDVYTDIGTQTVGTGQYAYIPKFGFYVKSPDGMQIIYQLDVTFAGTTHVPNVTFTGGKKNTNEYSYQAIGGCGASLFMDRVDLNQADLRQAGTASDGQLIYVYNDSNAQDLKDMFSQIYTPEGQTAPTYEQFLADNPIFFWQNPFGQFVRFKIMKYQPLAECGKPVIYLYPQTTEKVSVQVNPVGGLTYSDPLYKGGWNVVADPKSNLTNITDGKTYPYLFWEGRGGMYETPTKGFVVEKANVHEFLTDKLRKLGLNGKETADFEEFWEPKMQNSPYYFVTFLGNQAMDAIAPLSITPKPNTVIRILMDFTPLTQPIPVEGFNIHTPERKGFTVVEWGGVLR